MTVFWLLSALLAALALLLVLRPYFGRGGREAPSREAMNVSVHRDQLRELDADLASGALAKEDYERARRELERRLLEDTAEAPTSVRTGSGRATALMAAIAIPLLAVGTYLAVGTPAAIDSPAVQVDAMVNRLAARLKQAPDDAEGWRLLGRSQAALGRFKEAAEAYAQAAARKPRDAQLLADFADALAMARGQTLEGEPEKLVLRALEIDPANLKALALAGSAAFDRRDYAAAADFWARMLPHVAPGTEDARTIQANIDEARARSGEKASPAALKGVIQLSDKHKDKVNPDDTLFIFARAAQGPPMPLAVLRKQVRDLPVRFTLDDSMAMAPGMKLSAHPKVIVGARISRSGKAAPQPGDLQGLSAAVANNASDVTVLIDTVVR
jgi:cytochrome c-type biogenesis protein CcmH